MDSLIYEISKGIISGLISLGSIFYSSVSGVNPEFTPIEYSINGKSLYLTTQLINYSTPELDDIFRSGVPIKLNFHITVYLHPGSINPVKERIFGHEMVFDPLEEEFRLFFEETKKFQRFKKIDHAKMLFTQLKWVKIPLVDPPRGGTDFLVKIKVKPTRITLQELQQELDLLPYWNMTRPEISIIIPRKNFQQ